MKEVKIIDVFQEAPKKQVDEFNKNIQSKLNIDQDFVKIVRDVEWIEIISKTIPYLDNILRNPNRFIINEEEIVKIELARKITVDSIKHLTKNTNLIQQIDPVTGDVQPSKILNVNKEESYDTYENKLIYTLIQNMKFFVNRRKEIIEKLNNTGEKDYLHYKYEGSSVAENKNYNINVDITSADKGTNDTYKQELLNRIEKLQNDINMLTFSEVYKLIDKKHITLITPPIKKTNLILKNTNFQYAMKLWDYLQSALDDHSKVISDNNSYQDTGEKKELMDEAFLMQSLIMRSMNQNKTKEASEKESISIITDKIIEEYLSLNPDVTESDFMQMIKKKFAVIKYKETVTIKEIKNIFKQKFSDYINKVKRG